MGRTVRQWGTRLRSMGWLAHRGRPAWLGIAAAVLWLAACGGGGGGEYKPAARGLVRVTVTDSFGTAVPGATVQGPLHSSTTDAQGVALVVVGSPDGTADVKISSASFVDRSVTVTSTNGRVNEVTVTLVRVTSAAGGSMASRSGTLPTVGDDGRTLSFEIELVVVDGASRPLENMSGANFALRACAPDPADARIDCVQGAGAGTDLAYAPDAPGPEAWAPVPGHRAVPYAATLLLDQSGSIQRSDPTGARLYAAKTFLAELGAGDRALLAAFASGPEARIATPPLTVYAPFGDRAAARTVYAALDSLAAQVGGGTPLYGSVDAMRRRLVEDPTLPGEAARAVVVFTDGEDTDCGDPDSCRARRAQTIRSANDGQVRLFTIGLSGGVDAAALGELANQTGGAMLYADDAAQLLPLHGSLGALLSLSLPTHRLRWTVRAGAPGAFQSGGMLLGRVRVTAGTTPFEVPFIVGIP